MLQNGFGLVIVMGGLLLTAGLALGHAPIFGQDVAELYKPLVRHQKSQNHCYDTGSQDCERKTYVKEFTLGYLLYASNSTVPTKTLYACTDSSGLRHYVALTTAECKDKGTPFAKRLGYLAQTDELEASVPLVRCYDNDSGDTLLTDDANECTLAGYFDTFDQLGYVPAGGYLPLRRLNDLSHH